MPGNSTSTTFTSSSSRGKRKVKQVLGSTSDRAAHDERKRERLSRNGAVRCARCKKDDLDTLQDYRGVTLCANCRLKKAHSKESEEQKGERLVRLSRNGPLCCTLCSINDPDLLEGHHVEGEANSPLCVNLCANCHAKVSQSQEIEQPQEVLLRATKSRPALLAAFLFGISHLLEQLVILIRCWARYLWENRNDISLPGEGLPYGDI
jgi:hypothetical protein